MTVSESDIDLLARIAQIPDENIAQFRSMMAAAFEEAQRNCRGDGKNAHRPMTPIVPEIAFELKRVERAAERLFQALDELSPQSKKWLARFAVAGEWYGFEYEPQHQRFIVNDVQLLFGVNTDEKISSYRDVVAHIRRASALTKIYRAPKNRPSHLPPIRNRTQVEVGSSLLDQRSAFDLFVYKIINSCDMCGGELSHDKNDDNKGTLIRFLQAAAPNLPGGFIPKALPMSRLQSIISQCRDATGH